MKLLTAALLIFLSSNLFSQINRADSINQKDTTKVFPNPLEDTMQDTIATKDTVGILPVITTAINQINIHPFFSNSYFINKRFIERIDYNNVGGILKYAPFYEVINLGSSGQNNYLYAYGSTMYNVLEDGIPINTMFGIQAMNLIQTEDIDSLEIIQSTQSFMVSEGSAINILSKDFVSDSSYSRLKYFEGTEEEGFIDGMFNALVYKKLNMFINVTNKKVEQGYANTDHNYWQARFKLKYFLSEKFNILATYGYTQFHRGLNGGVASDSTGNIDEGTLYNEDLAPVRWSNQSEDILNHRIAAKILFQPSIYSQTDLSFYYHFLRDELNYIADVQDEFNHRRAKTLGAMLKQDFSFRAFNVLLVANYQNIKSDIKAYEPFYTTTHVPYIAKYPDENTFKLSAQLGLNLINSTFFPSIFLSYGDNDNGGIGGSLIYVLKNMVQLNFSASTYGISRHDNFTNYEAGISYRNNYDYLNLKYFRSEGGDYAIASINFGNNNYLNTYRDVSGFSLSASSHISKILIEGAANYYMDNITEPIYLSGTMLYQPSQLPDLNIIAGVYYTDILFNSNLDLKAGTKINYIANEKNKAYPNIFTLDININGRIQDRAIVFFTWENILDKRFYQIPYYPVRGRNIRFGVSWELFN